MIASTTMPRVSRERPRNGRAGTPRQGPEVVRGGVDDVRAGDSRAVVPVGQAARRQVARTLQVGPPAVTLANALANGGRFQGRPHLILAARAALAGERLVDAVEQMPRDLPHGWAEVATGLAELGEALSHDLVVDRDLDLHQYTTPGTLG